MKKSVPATNPEAYVNALSGWQRATVERLRAAVVGALHGLEPPIVVSGRASVVIASLFTSQTRGSLITSGDAAEFKVFQKQRRGFPGDGNGLCSAGGGRGPGGSADQ